MARTSLGGRHMAKLIEWQGKGQGKGQGKTNIGDWEPEIGMHLQFKSTSHAFYDDFPGGNQIRSQDADVDYDAPIVVLGVKTERCRRTDRNGAERDSNYVAVKFETAAGATLWTNYSRDGWPWLITPFDQAIEIAPPLQ